MVVAIVVGLPLATVEVIIVAVVVVRNKSLTSTLLLVLLLLLLMLIGHLLMLILFKSAVMRGVTETLSQERVIVAPKFKIQGLETATCIVEEINGTIVAVLLLP